MARYKTAVYLITYLHVGKITVLLDPEGARLLVVTVSPACA